MSAKVLNFWPLVLILEDSYYPDRAQELLQVAADLDDLLVDASAACDGLAAQIDAQLRQN